MRRRTSLGKAHSSMVVISHLKIALTLRGKMYTFGRGDSGQLGHGELLTAQSIPRELVEEEVAGVSCGSNICLAVTATKDVLSWGYGDLLQLGNGHESDEDTPVEIDLKGRRVIQAVAGGQHTLLVLGPRVST